MLNTKNWFQPTWHWMSCWLDCIVCESDTSCYCRVICICHVRCTCHVRCMFSYGNSTYNTIHTGNKTLANFNLDVVVMFVAGFLTETAHSKPSKPETNPIQFQTQRCGKGHKCQIQKSIPSNVAFDFMLVGMSCVWIGHQLLLTHSDGDIGTSVLGKGTSVCDIATLLLCSFTPTLKCKRIQPTWGLGSELASIFDLNI